MICSGEALPKAAAGPVLRAARRRAAQPVRPDRGRGRRDLPGRATATASLPVRADRQAGRQHPDPRPRRALQPVPVGVAGRAVHRRRPGRRAATSTGRSSRPSGSSPTRSRRARRAALPHRRPGALPARRQHRVPRPHRLPGQDPRLPHRARRDRGRPEAIPASRRPSSWPASARAATCELVAYVSSPAATGRRPRTPGTLLARLPAYMVPTHVRRDRAVPADARTARSTARRCPRRRVPGPSWARRTPRRDPSWNAWSPTSGSEHPATWKRSASTTGSSSWAARRCRPPAS